MLISKFLVGQKKIYKFIERLSVRENLTEFVKKGGLRSHFWPLKSKEWSLFKKNGQIIQRMMLPSRRANPQLHQRILIAIFKLLNAGTESMNRNEIFNSVWKSQLPMLIKDNKKLKNIWMMAKNENNVPRFSRGFKGNPGDKVEAQKIRQKKVLNCSSRNAQHKIELDAFKKFEPQYNDESEQKLYTQDVNKKIEMQIEKQEKFQRKGEDIKGKRKTDVFEAELPPPQRCRLSCPLPPPEYCPEEWKEFLPSYQSPVVKFASQPGAFLPSKSLTTKTSEVYTLKPENRTANTKKLPRKLSSNNLTSKMIKTKKIYPSSLKYLKSQMYEPKTEIIPKMKALLFEPDSLSLNYYVVDAPTQIYKDEVLIQVIYSGVCGTDLFITEGKMSCGDGPLILGHEISGKVYAVGSQVHHVKIGDNVSINPYTACNFCRYCTKGLYSSCINEGLNNSIGISKDGGWAEFLVVKKSQVHKILPETGLDQAALIQPLSCVLSAMSKLKLSYDLDILIQGLGLAGCLWASVLHKKGFKKVFVCEKSDKKREQFQFLNLGYKIVSLEDLPKQSADIIIECTGSPLSIEKSLKILNPNGQICFFGKPSPLTEVRCMPYEIVRKEITIFGNTGNAFCFSKAVDFASTMGYQYLDFEKLGIKVFELQDFREAFQMKRSGEVGKIMFKFDS